ncbi:YdcF family protein [Ramlibacter sp. AN1133]|uniref:YdcF family protein n=1 Tax=Ramlibacter sp. AN1133 TaxID=3133429 RepID=UPI0030C18643
MAVVFLAGTEAGARFLLSFVHDDSPAVRKEQAAQAQAIVVLGGNRDRVHEAARLHSLTRLPILLAGKGTGDSPYEAESEKMAWMLRTQHGIEPRWVEKHSVNTHENAQESWCLLKAEGVQRIVLVTHAKHMARARYEFRWAGFTVVSDPIPDPSAPPPRPSDFVPGQAGWRSVVRALDEYRDLAFAVVEDLVTEPRCGTGAAP